MAGRTRNVRAERRWALQRTTRGGRRHRTAARGRIRESEHTREHFFTREQQRSRAHAGAGEAWRAPCARTASWNGLEAPSSSYQ